MSTALDNEALDKAKAEELISEVELIPEVKSIDVELYTDHTGDPSFQLVFGLREDVLVDSVFMKRFLQFERQVQTKILHSDLNRFPYTKLKRTA
jgi:hypothetical protein